MMKKVFGLCLQIIDKLTNAAKKRFFNADDNNVPEKEEIGLEQKELKFDRKFQTNEFERSVV